MAATIALRDILLVPSSSSASTSLPGAALGYFNAVWDETAYPGAAKWIEFKSRVALSQSTSHVTLVLHKTRQSEYVPRTPFGHKLLAIRKAAIDRGMELLSEEQVLEEVRRRRGGLESSDAHLH